MTRGAFNKDCDVFFGPGTSTPGLLIGTFDCRLVREDDIFPEGLGTPPITHYLTILDYQPVGAWTHPDIGYDPTLADEIAVPAGTAPRVWVAYVKEIVAGTQLPYHRAYLCPLPTPSPLPIGGVLLGGAALVETDLVILPSGGVLLGGAATVVTDIVILPSGGVLLGGYALINWTIKILPTGGVLLGGYALIDWTIKILPTGGLLLGGEALVETNIVILPTGGLLLGGEATVVIPTIITGTGGIVLGGEATVVTSLIGKALHFVRSSTQYLSMGGVSALDFNHNATVSVTCWIRTTNSTNHMCICGKYNLGVGWFASVLFGAPLLQFESSGSDYIYKYGGASYADGNWHFFAVTYNGNDNSSGLKLYVDGTLETGTNAGSSGTLGTTTNPHEFSVARRDNDPLANLYADFDLDELHVYNTELTSGQITTAYNAGVGVKGVAGETGLVAGWHFDEGSGTTANDFQGTANGSLVNGPTWITGKIVS